MRERIFTIVEKGMPGDRFSKAYDYIVFISAIISIIPLMFKETYPIFNVTDTVTVYILFLDYVMRWITYDFKLEKKGARPFLLYPVSFFGIVDLVSIMPSLGLIGSQFRILRMLRIFKILHYSKSFVYISNVFKKESRTLGNVLIIAVFYIFVSALAMFAYEPDTFDNFFGALYWATTALTTVGYGDVFPHTNLGRLISMISSLFGIAVIALPAGIVTAGFMEQVTNEKEQLRKDEEIRIAEAAKAKEARDEAEELINQLKEVEGQGGTESYDQ